jgi:hypothetical protein
VCAELAMLSGARDGREDGKGNGKLASGAAVLTSATIKTASIERSICKWRWAAEEQGGECAHEVYAMSSRWRTLEKQESPGAGTRRDGRSCSCGRWRNGE